MTPAYLAISILVLGAVVVVRFVNGVAEFLLISVAAR